MMMKDLMLLALLGLTAASTVSANPDNDDKAHDPELAAPRAHHKCASNMGLSQATKAKMMAAQKEYEAQLDERNRGRRRLNAVTVDVHMHALRKVAGFGKLRNSDRDEFMDYLADGFAGTDFSFNFVAKYNVYNDQYHLCREESTYKGLNRVGTSEDLNVYFCDYRNEVGYVGASTFPADYGQQPTRDGVIMHNPLISSPSTDLEVWTTIIHEVGHWLGLFHTFEDGCVSGGSNGDQVSDTAAQLDESWNYGGWTHCFSTRKSPQGTGTKSHIDSCPSIDDGSGAWKGIDRVNNYMNYIHEDCMANGNASFTTNQIIRMDGQWDTFRDFTRRRRLNGEFVYNTTSEAIEIDGDSYREVRRTNGKVEIVRIPAEYADDNEEADALEVARAVLEMKERKEAEEQGEVYDFGDRRLRDFYDRRRLGEIFTSESKEEMLARNGRIVIDNLKRMNEQRGGLRKKMPEI